MSSYIKENITCPITFCIFLNPAICNDGQTYERDVILKMFGHKSLIKSPITHENIYLSSITTNYAVKKMVDDYLSHNPDEKSEQYRIEFEYTYEFIQKYSIDDLKTSLGDEKISIDKFSHITLKDIFSLVSADKVKFVIDNVDNINHYGSKGFALIHYARLYSFPSIFAYICHKAETNIDLKTVDGYDCDSLKQYTHSRLMIYA